MHLVPRQTLAAGYNLVPICHAANQDRTGASRQGRREGRLFSGSLPGQATVNFCFRPSGHIPLARTLEHPRLRMGLTEPTSYRGSAGQTRVVNTFDVDREATVGARGDADHALCIVARRLQDRYAAPLIRPAKGGDDQQTDCGGQKQCRPPSAAPSSPISGNGERRRQKADSKKADGK